MYELIAAWLNRAATSSFRPRKHSAGDAQRVDFPLLAPEFTLFAMLRNSCSAEGAGILASTMCGGN
jgi:hypothetical protein